jgi:peroxidase
VNPHWEDNRLFSEARRILIAVYQHINYDQYIPSIIGRRGSARFELVPTEASKYFHGYDPYVNPSISNEFSTAAMRFGHSTVNNDFDRFTSNNSLIDSDLTFSAINFKVEQAYK